MKVSTLFLVLLSITTLGCASAPAQRKADNTPLVLSMPGMQPLQVIDPVREVDGSLCFTPLLTTKRVCLKVPGYILSQE
jgi:hypothetical protein